MSVYEAHHHKVNKFMEGAGFVGSIWKLKVSLNSFYTVIPKCFRVPRPVGT